MNQLTNFIKRFIGLSTDTKPVDNPGSVFKIPPESRYYELDTGYSSVFDGNSTWYPDLVNLGNGTGNPVNAQNPLPTDGDSVYAKDIDLDNSSIDGFSGSILDLFNNRTSTISNATSDNPKEITIALKRPIHNKEIALVTSSGSFSNTKLIFKNAAGTTLEIIDESASSTQYTSRAFQLKNIDKWCVLTVQFHTANTITLSFALVYKAIQTYSRLFALKPDGTVTPIDATAGGNLKVSVEEGDNADAPIYTLLSDNGGSFATVEDRTQTPTGKALNVQIGPGDIISNIPVVMTFDQHQIHEGESHKFEHYSASPASINFALLVPAYDPTIEAPHLLMHIQILSGAQPGSCELSLWEAATYTGGSEVTTIYNANRNYQTNLAGLDIISGVTIDSPGTRLPYTLLAGGTGRTGAESHSSDEIILKPSTTYIVKFEQIAALSRVAIHLEWYEDLGV